MSAVLPSAMQGKPSVMQILTMVLGAERTSNIRAVLSEIAADKARHARQAWRCLGWLHLAAEVLLAKSLLADEALASYGVMVFGRSYRRTVIEQESWPALRAVSAPLSGDTDACCVLNSSRRAALLSVLSHDGACWRPQCIRPVRPFSPAP